MNPFGTGALESQSDPRTVKHEDVTATGDFLVKGGQVYSPEDIEHQHKVGICTAICLTQNRAKVNGKKYSADFQYLLQKKYYDQNWYEGSSIFNALRVGKNIGFLPVELFPIGETDRFSSYQEYIAKLQAIPDAEVERLKTLCVDKIQGYASVDVSDSQSIARAINESEGGILCRYGCGDTWWLPSWLPKDINPLRKPIRDTSGHAILMTAFEYTYNFMQKLANTWGKDWNLQGNADIDYSNYPMYEAWTILPTAPVVPPYKFTRDLFYGSRGDDVKMLQKWLNKNGYTVTLNGQETSFFGRDTRSAVANLQKANGLFPAWGYFGPKTRAYVNSH